MIPFLIGGLAATGLFGSLTVTRFEREAAAGIRSGLKGEHRQVSVQAHLGIEALFGTVRSLTISASHFDTDSLPFHTEPNRSQRGFLRHLHLNLTNFSLAGLQVDRLDAVVSRCRFDLALALAHHKFRLTRSGTGPADVVIRDASFEPFIAQKFPSVHSVSVRMQAGVAHISGLAQIGFLTAPFKIDSRLGTRNENQLVFIDPQVSLGIGKPDPKLAQILVHLFDPIVDLDKDLHMEHAVTVDSVEITDGFLIGHGKVTIPDLKPQVPSRT